MSQLGIVSCCTNGLGSIGVDIFVEIGLKHRLLVQVGHFSIQDSLKGPYYIVQSNQWLISLFVYHCIPHPPWVYVRNGDVIFLFGRQPNRGNLDKIMRNIGVNSPCLTGLVPLVIIRIGTEYLSGLLFEWNRGKRYKRIIVNINASKSFFSSK